MRKSPSPIGSNRVGFPILEDQGLIVTNRSFMTRTRVSPPRLRYAPANRAHAGSHATLSGSTAVAEATGDSQREVIRKVNRGQKAHYGIRPTTEALLLAADAGVDVAPFLDEARQGLVQRVRD